MRILLSNDDGVQAQGLGVLAHALAPVATVHVIAPDKDRSGASNALTLDRPLQPVRLENGFYVVDGTPTDCVHLGLTSIFNFQAERVISGINSHANLGDDVIYSGTVAAALEGRFLPQPAIAVSLVSEGKGHYATAARVIRTLLEKRPGLVTGPRTVLNINVPDLPYEQLKGIRVTRLGHRSQGNPPEKIVDPRGKSRYWIAKAGEEEDAGPGTDFHAVAAGYVSITPIHVDMTCHDALADVSHWAGEEQVAEK